MPQPLSRGVPGASVIIGNAGHRVLSERPQLAVLAIEAIASSSNVDNFLLRLFVRLLGGNAALATQIYLRLETRSAKNAAIATVVEAMADRGHADVAQALVGISKGNKKSRDKLAHHVSGISPNLPDALLLIDPKALALGAPGGQLDPDEIFVYRATDLQDIVVANDSLCGYGMKLEFIIDGHPSNADGRLYE